MDFFLEGHLVYFSITITKIKISLKRNFYKCTSHKAFTCQTVAKTERMNYNQKDMVAFSNPLVYFPYPTSQVRIKLETLG